MVSEIKRILFASDLSAGAKQAFGHALNVAVCHEASILIVHVAEKLAPGTEERVAAAFGEDLYDELKHRRSQSAHDILIDKKVEAVKVREELERTYREAIAEKPEKSAVVENIYVVEGDVASEILSIAQQKACDLIVLGMQRRSRIAQAFSSDKVEKVLRRSDRPVLVVPYKDSSR
jgi:nucleotide-binding universal stress UspA family protein